MKNIFPFSKPPDPSPREPATKGEDEVGACSAQAYQSWVHSVTVWPAITPLNGPAVLWPLWSDEKPLGVFGVSWDILVLPTYCRLRLIQGQNVMSSEKQAESKKYHAPLSHRSFTDFHHNAIDNSNWSFSTLLNRALYCEEAFLDINHENAVRLGTSWTQNGRHGNR